MQHRDAEGNLSQPNRAALAKHVANLFAHGLNDQDVCHNVLRGTGVPHPDLGFRVDATDVFAVVRDLMTDPPEEELEGTAPRPGWFVLDLSTVDPEHPEDALLYLARTLGGNDAKGYAALQEALQSAQNHGWHKGE